MNHPKYIIRKNKAGKFYFVLTAKNGKTILKSESYNSIQACNAGIRSVRTNAPGAEVEKSYDTKK